MCIINDRNMKCLQSEGKKHFWDLPLICHRFFDNYILHFSVSQSEEINCFRANPENTVSTVPLILGHIVSFSVAYNLKMILMFNSSISGWNI